MESTAHAFLKQLLLTPSPSGYEGPIQKVVRDYVGTFADTVTTDVHGNVIACKNPDAPLRLMFAGHCDQIGLLVTHVDESGFIYTQTIGGWDPIQLVGQRMTIWTDSGPIPAVIARKPIHLLKDEERKQTVKQDDLWLDMGAANKSEVIELVRIGDPVTLELGYQEMRNNLANSPGMDNRTGLWVVMEGLRRAALNNPTCGIYAVSTVQEEIGLRGAQTSAFGVKPHVAIAVDVTHATDCPTIDKRQQGDIALGKGPVIYRGPNMNPRVTSRLIDQCEKHELPYQLAAIGRATPNDTNSIQVSRSGVATGLVSIPNRYMHSAVETISLDDIDRAADLLAAFACSLGESEDFTP
ncbi:MAG: M42 family metallopeptidase [Planctomycetaceae bacterium]|nr:M42 family metallopeptidase [Planctomycetales bacterium]MCB9925198.1 M42 family metallopeptidase [Planctomycetaceae bacterium]